MHEDDDFPDHIHLEPGETAEDVEGIEKLSLTSVGIDIGSSTSHLVFSHLTLRRKGANLSTQFEVSERIVLYRSPILLTPYKSPTLIDVDQLREFFDRHYAQAGFTPDSIDTGAVVITGEALNKENARPIAELFAQHSGKFICASAGPNHEALLAAHGCGAVALSKADHGAVLNVDIGGGTSKLSLIRDGVVTSTAAISVGARLVAFDADGRVSRIEQPAERMLRELGDTRQQTAGAAGAEQARVGGAAGNGRMLGQTIDDDTRRKLAELMAGCLFEVMAGEPRSALTRDLMVTEQGLRGYDGLAGVGAVVFSGGVSEYIYQHDSTAYGDLGPLLGAAMRTRLRQGHVHVHEPVEGIRATVIGAGEYTIQASGMTSYLSDLSVLPAFGLKVVKVRAGESFTAALAKFDLACYGEGLALAIAVEDRASYKLVRAIAEEVAALVGQSSAPLYLVLDADVAKSLGGILKEELRLPGAIIAVDGIDVGDLDYVDIGRPMGVSESLPVTVKSLMFPRG